MSRYEDPVYLEDLSAVNLAEVLQAVFLKLNIQVVLVTEFDGDQESTQKFEVRYYGE